MRPPRLHAVRSPRAGRFRQGLCGWTLAALLIATLASAGAVDGPAPARQPAAEAPQNEPLEIGFLAFGDSGLHYDYMQTGTPAPTKEAFIAKYRRYWIGNRRDPRDFRPPPAYFHGKLDSFVIASGMQPVASAMQRLCLDFSCAFAVMLGDNIYPSGAEANEDDRHRFRVMFSEPFGDFGSGNPDYRIYTALGNHDWRTSREGAMAQVTFLRDNPPFFMDGNVYRVKPPAAKGQVEIFVIDTTVLLAGETVPLANLHPDGSEAATGKIESFDPWAKPATTRERNMADWLEESLRGSTARWRFVAAHHPIWSTGGYKFEQARVLRRLLLPALCRHADGYLAGHDHTLELHEDSCAAVLGDESVPLLQIVSGAASKQRGVNTAFRAHQSARYPANRVLFAKGMTWGFAHLQLKGDRAVVSMFSTPNSSSGDAVLEFRHAFTRRSGQLGHALVARE